jgi:hypothetical protein
MEANQGARPTTRGWASALLRGTGLFAMAVLAWLAVWYHAFPCYLYWYGIKDLLPLLFLWPAFVLFFAPTEFRWGTRLGVIGVLLFMGWPHGEHFAPAAGTAANAVGAMREFHKSLELAKKQNGTYPDLLPPNARPSVTRHYSFEYQPHFQGGYLLRATPTAKARACGCDQSLVALADGKLHYTLENRPAALTDSMIDP